MAIKIGDNFLYRGKKPLDERDSFNNIADMKAYDETSLDEGHISYCKAQDKYYKFNSSNEDDPTTGKWREYNAGGSTMDIVDDLNTQSAIAPLSANQGYILSQMFLSDLKFNSITREVELISKNGTKTTYSLKTFIDDVHKTLMQSKAIYCDKLPTCAQDSDGNYIVTYVKGGATLTTSAANTWFYYKDNNREDVQTIFVDGEEITIQSGTIGDVVAIDPVSKNWLINGVDTGESSKGDAGKDGKSIRSITKDDENNIIVTFSDSTTQNIGKLQIDIQGDFLTANGFGNLRYYNGHFQYYDKNTSTWIDTSVTPDNVYMINMIPQPMVKIFGVYDINQKKYKLKFQEPADTIIDGQLACEVEKVVIRRKLGSVPINETDGELVLEVPRSDFGSYKNVYYVDEACSPNVGDTYYYKAFPVSSTGIINNSTDNQVSMLCKEYELYGFRINQNESNPDAMITYLADNAEYEPAHMDFSKDIFNYGSWDTAFFIRNIKPCMLKKDGTVDYELDPNDFSKRKDNGLDSDISNESYEGNAMVGIPTAYVKFVKIDDNTAEYYISNKKIDDDYNCFAHLDANGNVMPYTYMPIYNSSLINNCYRSLSGKAAEGHNTGDAEIKYINNNNIDGSNIWYGEVFSDRQLLNLLIYLISKSTNVRAKFGIPVQSYINTGNTDQCGLFYGTTNGSKSVKIFGIENYYGLCFRRVAGCLFSSSYTKIKACYGQQDGSTADGYDDINATGYITFPKGLGDSGYIKKCMFTKYGIIATTSGGSSNKYYCSGATQNASSVSTLMVGTDAIESYSYAGILPGILGYSFTSRFNSNTLSTSLSCKPLVHNS